MFNSYNILHSKCTKNKARQIDLSGLILPRLAFIVNRLLKPIILALGPPQDRNDQGDAQDEQAIAHLDRQAALGQRHVLGANVVADIAAP